MKKESKLKHIIAFFIIAYALSWLLWSSSVINTQVSKMPDILLLISNFALLGPMIAAIIMLSKEGGKKAVGGLFGDAWNWKFKPIWLLPTLLLPAAMILITLAIKLPIEGKAFEIYKTPMPIYLFVIVLFFAGGPLEEFGWRGYALPRLIYRYSFLPAALILGALHGLWHLPLHFMEGTVQSVIPIGEFIAVTTVGSIIYTWIYKHTKSLTLLILHHWAANLAAALLVYWDTPLGRWTFFGVQLAVAIIIVISELVHESKIAKSV